MSDTSVSSYAGPSVARPLRVAALAEAASFAVLLVAMAAKYGLDAPGEGGVPIIGPIHGIIVLVYAALVLMGRDEQGWSIPQALLAIVLSAVPGGGLYVERRMMTVPPRG